MFVGDRMSRPVITITQDTPIIDALAMFKKEHIRRAPVMNKGKLVGIVTETDLLNASPSDVSTLK
jgi:acetoin utilization protein AcuB